MNKWEGQLRQRRDRTTRKARNIALAYWIDDKIRSGDVADMACMAKLCGVSRARVTKVVDLLGLPTAEQEQVMGRSER